MIDVRSAVPVSSNNRYGAEGHCWTYDTRMILPAYLEQLQLSLSFLTVMWDSTRDPCTLPLPFLCVKGASNRAQDCYQVSLLARGYHGTVLYGTVGTLQVQLLRYVWLSSEVELVLVPINTFLYP